MIYSDEQRMYSEALNLHNTFNHAYTFELAEVCLKSREINRFTLKFAI